MTGGEWVRTLNTSSNKVQDSLLNAFGMGELLSVKLN